MTFPKRLLLFLACLFACSSLAGFIPNSALALCDGGIAGPKIAGHTSENWFRAIREEYDKANDGCQGQRIPVTIIFYVTDSQDFYENILKLMVKYSLRPIIRIASGYGGGVTGWRKITDEEAANTASKLKGALNNTGIADAIVYFGNEPNLPFEWGDGDAGGLDDPSVEARLKSFTHVFKVFAQNSQDARYQVFFPPLALYQSADFSREKGWLERIVLPEVGNLIDGAALTLYNYPAAAIDNDYQIMKTFYNSHGINNLIISEVGPRINGELLQHPCKLEQWIEIVSSIYKQNPGSGIFSGAKVVNTSFFWDQDCDGHPDDTLLVVIGESGDVEVYYVNKGKAVLFEDYLKRKGQEYYLTHCTCEIPPLGPTYGRDVPCKPLEISQSGYGDDYFLPYSNGYPFDYSPFRPFPGDSSKDIVQTTGSCYDLTNANVEPHVVSYCNPSPQTQDTLKWFPNINKKTDSCQDFLFPVKLKGWWADHPQLNEAAEVPFLGSSLTSNQQFTDNRQRMAFFLTDYLRGTAYWDRAPVDTDDPEDYRRVVDESGPIRRLYPENILRDDKRKENFIKCRLEDKNCVTDTENLSFADPVHDYALIWGNEKDPVAEGGFTDLPDRRTSEKGESLKPIRLSTAQKGSLAWDYYFPLTSREDIPAFVDLKIESAWPKDDKGEQLTPKNTFPDSYGPIETIDMQTLYFAVDKVHLEGGGTSSYQGNSLAILWKEVKDNDGKPKTSKTEKCDNTPEEQKNLAVFEIHFVELVYIPYIPEARELSEWAGQPISPFKIQSSNSNQNWQKLNTSGDDNFNALSLVTAPNCDDGGVALDGYGDILAGDFHFEENVALDTTETLSNKLPGLWFYQEWSHPTSSNVYGCNDAGSTKFPVRTSITEINTTPTINTYIPYLKLIAQRLIGSAGVFRTLLPQSFNKQVIEAITGLANGKTNWYELPGYGQGHFAYKNFLTDQDVKNHFGYCDTVEKEEDCDTDPLTGYTSCHNVCIRSGEKEYPCCFENCNADDCKYCAKSSCDNCGPTLDAESRNYRGTAAVNDKDAKFFYPYTGAIDIFRQYLVNAMSPAAALSQSF